MSLENVGGLLISALLVGTAWLYVVMGVIKWFKK